MTIEIPLTQGQVAIVSDEDADLAGLKWCAIFCPGYSNGGAYKASRNVPLANGKRTSEQMHRVILSRMLGRPLLRSEEVDHIHGNTLDNRRSELRLATRSQNGMNKGKTRANASGFKGVSWDTRTHKWRARISINRKCTTLGYFDTPEEAHEAYKKAAPEYHGEWMRTE